MVMVKAYNHHGMLVFEIELSKSETEDFIKKIEYYRRLLIAKTYSYIEKIEVGNRVFIWKEFWSKAEEVV